MPLNMQGDSECRNVQKPGCVKDKIMDGQGHGEFKLARI